MYQRHMHDIVHVSLYTVAILKPTTIELLRHSVVMLIMQDIPPHIPSPVPFLGHAVGFGRDPINFLIKAHKKVSYTVTIPNHHI